FILCLALLFAVIALMARISGRESFRDLLGLPDIAAQPDSSRWTKDRFMLHAGVSFALIAAAGAYVHFGTSNILRVPDRIDLAGLPYELDGWESQPQQVDSATVEVLGADDFLITELRSPENERFNLYIAYLDMQRHGHSWHSPRQCIP